MKYPSPDPSLYQALLRAYYRCLENKRHVKKKSFHLMHEGTIHALALDIENRTYRPGTSNVFVVAHPKPREVIAGNLRDRIVHHFLYEYMSPYWERRFLENSYACRAGKGPLRANIDLRKFLRAHCARGGRPLFYLQLDIQNFFPSIDLNILRGIITRHLENPLYLWLCERVICHRATLPGNFMLTSPKSLWGMVPRYKSLFHAPRDRGLCIGNLTSQFFANIYMNQLDQFIAREIAAKGRCLYWQRYMDDILFISDDQAALRGIVAPVGEFSRRMLRLELNPKKTLLQPLCRGLDHLGYWHKPTYYTARRRVENNCKARLFEFEQAGPEPLDADLACSTLNSYFGYFRNAYSQRLRRGLAQRIRAAAVFADVIAVDAEATKVVRVIDQDVAKRKIETERALQDEFVAAFAQCELSHEPRGTTSKRARSYVRDWQSIADLVEAAGECFRPSPAGRAISPPDFRGPRRRPHPRPHGLTHTT